MRGVEGEKKRRGAAGGGRDGKREATAARARSESGEPRGSIGGHRPPQKSAHYHPPRYRRVDGGDDARFINICRRNVKQFLVADENRYRTRTNFDDRRSDSVDYHQGGSLRSEVPSSPLPYPEPNCFLQTAPVMYQTFSRLLQLANSPSRYRRLSPARVKRLTRCTRVAPTKKSATLCVFARTSRRAPRARFD